MSRALVSGIIVDGGRQFTAGTHYAIIPNQGWAWMTVSWSRYAIADGAAISAEPGVGVSTALNLYATNVSPSWLFDRSLGYLAAPNETIPARGLPDYPHWYQPPGLTFGGAIPLAADTREGGFVTITDSDSTHIILELVVPGAFSGLYVHSFGASTV